MVARFCAFFMMGCGCGNCCTQGSVSVSESIELATILVTDLVGSTRLATSVGPARADELRDEHFALLREAIGASGGRRVQEHRRRADGGVQLRVGGGAVRGVDAAAVRAPLPAAPSRSCRCGSAWARASRRSRTATTSGCRRSRRRGCATRRRRTGSWSRRRCGCWPRGSTDIRFDSVGELELKGFPEPVEAFAVPWTSRSADEAAGVGGWPLPALLAVGAAGRLRGARSGASADGALA